jgi:hypothetical protein
MCPEDDPLRPHPDDELHRVARAVIGTLPLGSMLKEMFTGIVADPAQRRRDAIIRDLLIRLKRLEQNAGLDLAQLAAREDFVATFVRVIQAASREVEKEKMALLKNAVINTAMGDDLDGEAVAHCPEGLPAFNALLRRSGALQRASTPFDLLHIGDEHLRGRLFPA